MQTSRAKMLSSKQRKNIALQIISNHSIATQLSKQYQTIRKFINQQTNKFFDKKGVKRKSKT